MADPGAKWDSVAAAYAKATERFFGEIATQSFDKLPADFSPKTMIDLASGPGPTVIEAKTRYKTNSPEQLRIIATDISAEMLEEIKKKTECETLVCSMDAIPVEKTGKADLVACQFGAEFLTDRGAFWTGIKDVLQPGGRCLVSSWNEKKFVQVFMQSVKAIAPDSVANLPPPQLKEPDDVRKEMEAAGFDTVDVHLMEVHWPEKSAEAMLQSVLSFSPMVQGVYSKLESGDQEKVRTVCLEKLAAFETADGGVSLPCSFNLGVGSVL